MVWWVAGCIRVSTRNSNAPHTQGLYPNERCPDSFWNYTLEVGSWVVFHLLGRKQCPNVWLSLSTEGSVIIFLITGKSIFGGEKLPLHPPPPFLRLIPALHVMNLLYYEKLKLPLSKITMVVVGLVSSTLGCSWLSSSCPMNISLPSTSPSSRMETFIVMFWSPIKVNGTFISWS